MTIRRQSNCESVIKKSLKVQEKLKERAKKKGVAKPESGPSVDKAPAVEDNSSLTSNINIDPNPADTDSSEQNSDEEVNLITFEEVEQELVNPNKVKMNKTEYNTQFIKVKSTEIAVKNSIARFNSGTVSAAVLDSYKTSLQNIEKKLEAFEENVTDILINLEDDDPRKDDLKAKRVKLYNEVKEMKMKYIIK